MTEETPKQEFGIPEGKKWLPCGLCHGYGYFTEYEETWPCPCCEGEGGSLVDK